MAETQDPKGSPSGPCLYSAGSEPPGRPTRGILRPPGAPSPPGPATPLPGTSGRAGALCDPRAVRGRCRERPEVTRSRRKSRLCHPRKSRPLPPPESRVSACFPRGRPADMAHYNFKKITVVPSAKVSVRGPSALAFFLQRSPAGPATQATSSKLGVPRARPPPRKRVGSFLRPSSPLQRPGIPSSVIGVFAQRAGFLFRRLSPLRRGEALPQELGSFLRH